MDAFRMLAFMIHVMPVFGVIYMWIYALLLCSLPNWFLFFCDIWNFLVVDLRIFPHICEEEVWTLNFGPIWLIDLPSLSLETRCQYLQICFPIWSSYTNMQASLYICHDWYILFPVDLNYIVWGIYVFVVIQLLFKYLDERTRQITLYIYRGLELRYFTFVFKCV